MRQIKLIQLPFWSCYYRYNYLFTYYGAIVNTGINVTALSQKNDTDVEYFALNFVCRTPVAVARSSSGGVALCYVLPVLWMKLYLAVMGTTSKDGG